MSRRPIVGIVSALLLVNITVLVLDIQPVKSEPTIWIVDDDGPADFHTIQEAIDASNPGDIIHVFRGVYFEHLIVNKKIYLFGDSRGTTIIDGNLTGDNILVQADNVTINGFTLQRSWHGIRLYKSSFTVISENEISNTGYGIYQTEGKFNRISLNTILDNTIGIVILGSSYNIVEKNFIWNNFNCGIDIGQSSNNTIFYNYITRNTRGVALVGSHTSRNRIVANRILNSGEGFVLMDKPRRNMIYHNDFINNTHQVNFNYFPSEMNDWDDGYPSGGNYWSDYEDRYPNALEIVGSGIWDTPYILDENNQDNYPLLDPWVTLSSDVSGNGKVDMRDVGIVAYAYGSYPRHPRWNHMVDMNMDLKIDLKDIAFIARHFGETDP